MSIDEPNTEVALNQDNDLSFTIETDAGPVPAVVSREVLRTLAGRSHITTDELLSIYRYELEEAAKTKVGQGTASSIVRIEAADL